MIVILLQKPMFTPSICKILTKKSDLKVLCDFLIDKDFLLFVSKWRRNTIFNRTGNFSNMYEDYLLELNFLFEVLNWYTRSYLEVVSQEAFQKSTKKPDPYLVTYTYLDIQT